MDSYRREMLDFLQEKYKYLYKGIVLDIGGRDRGKFKKPRNKVKKWIFADIDKKFNPDIILDVANMKSIDSNSIDVVNALELFEHVQNIEKGLSECYRVLKKNGVLILSIPFLIGVHADPYDFQRWTYYKWYLELKKYGFKIQKFYLMGKYFTLLADMLKDMIAAKKKTMSHGKSLLNIFYPFINLIFKYDNKSFVKNDLKLNNYHNGYFIIGRK